MSFKIRLNDSRSDTIVINAYQTFKMYNYIEISVALEIMYDNCCHNIRCIYYKQQIKFHIKII